jgi:hypothetical protein
MRKRLFSLLLVLLPFFCSAQEGTLSGDLQTNINFFMKDTAIKACCNELYDNYLTGHESWLSLRYNVNGWTFFLRGDAFTNSNLYSPTTGLTAYGVGAYSITKEMGDLTVIGGYIYDQIGSGLLFRSYEDRGLLIDNAVVGLELKYKPTKNISLKAFSGQQKFILNKYPPVLRGFNAEGDYQIKKVHIIPGVGVFNRTLDKDNMSKVASAVQSYDTLSRFYPKWNMYAFSLYNTLNYKSFSWYIEGAYKTNEAIYNFSSKLIDKPGNAVFTTLNYAVKGLAVNVSAKRTENFVMRTSPNEVLVNGMLNWQPVVARLRPQRLISRYSPPSQDLSELATTVDLLYSPNDESNFGLTYTRINRLDDTLLYRELFLEYNYQSGGKWIFELAAQYMEYNQEIYQVKPLEANPIIFALTPIMEITYKITESKSLRFEAQYMNTKQDFGSWAFALLEFNVAPKYSISISDMYNIAPNYASGQMSKANHYYSVYGAFTKGPHRFSLAYVKQVAGINCTGGVCRFEPAFSGVRSTFSTSF